MPIAERIDDNVRALQGALIRVVAFHSLTGRAVDRALVDDVLDGLYPGLTPPRAPHRAEIQEGDLRGARGLPRGAAVARAAARRVAWARQVAMYLSRELTDATLPAIGRAFGGRNHTTVMHACRRTAERIAADPRRLRGRSAGSPRASRSPVTPPA